MLSGAPLRKNKIKYTTVARETQSGNRAGDWCFGGGFRKKEKRYPEKYQEKEKIVVDK